MIKIIKKDVVSMYLNVYFICFLGYVFPFQLLDTISILHQKTHNYTDHFGSFPTPL